MKTLAMYDPAFDKTRKMPNLTLALQYAVKEKLVSEKQLKLLEDDFAAITHKIAQEFRLVKFEAEMLDAQLLGIGCISLALELECGSDLKKSTEQIIHESLPVLFRKGNTRILKLTRQPVVLAELSDDESVMPLVDYAELFHRICACSGYDNWNGFTNYPDAEEPRKRIAREKQMIFWLIQKITGQDPQTYVNMLKEEGHESPGESYFTSAFFNFLLPRGQPKLTLNRAGQRYVAEYMKKTSIEVLTAKSEKFIEWFPARHQATARIFQKRYLAAIDKLKKNQVEVSGYMELMEYCHDPEKSLKALLRTM